MPDPKPRRTHLEGDLLKPLLPAPWVTTIALACTFGLILNIFLDGALGSSYDGAQGTYVLGGIVAGVLGLPFGFAMFRRNGDEQEPKQ